MAQLDVKAAEAKTGDSAQETIDPTTGGLNVHIAGGAQLPAALGRAAAAASLPVVLSTEDAAKVPALVGGAIPVVDVGVAIVAGGVTSCATSTLVATSQTGAGYLTIKNLEASGGATIYVGLTGVTTNGLPLLPGESDTAYYANVATVFAAGSTTVGWCLRR